MRAIVFFTCAALAAASSADASETATSTRSFRQGVSFVPEQPRLGDLVQVEVTSSDRALTRGTARLFRYEIELFRVDARRLRGIAAVPIDIEPQSYLVEVELGGLKQKAWVQVIDRPFDASELKVDPKFTKKPGPALRKRLIAEQQQWGAMWKPPANPPRFFGEIERPVDGIQTAPYGTRRIFNGKTNTRHYGLDLEAKTGDPVHAVQAGKVVMSSMRWASGGTIVVDHGSGLFTAYFHLSQRAKKKGDWVDAGERIGAAGRTGRVTGPHLHLAVMVRMVGTRANGKTVARGLYVDPMPFLSSRFEGDPAFLEGPAAKKRAVQQGKTRRGAR